ncbi:MAG: hypothetical protein JO282_00330 [Alphaproteobacteria bacterium]|nr:hypothetical protein [Alphaproteobacteria bacterium]
MGGHISVASLELYPEVYRGALIECGVIDGVGLADWLYAYTAAAQYFSELPLLDTPRPEFDELVYTKWLAAMGEPGYYTDRGQRFDSVVKYLAGGDLPLLLEGLALRYVQDLHPRDPGPAHARELARHADTRQINYDIDPELGVDAATLNREIPRVLPEPGARSPTAITAEVFCSPDGSSTLIRGNCLDTALLRHGEAALREKPDAHTCTARRL